MFIDLDCCGVNRLIILLLLLMFLLIDCLYFVGCFDIILNKINMYGSLFIVVFVVNCVIEVNK